jgi:hypothetical protein
LLSEIPSRVSILNHEYIKFSENYTTNSKSGSFTLTHFTGKALVSFQFEHYKQYFIRKYEEDDEFMKISGKPVRIEDAPNPEDIYWFNLRVGDSTRFRYIMYSWGVLVMVLILTYALLQGINYLKKDISSVDLNQGVQNQIGTILLTLLMAGITALINKILYDIMKLLSFLEKHETKTQRMQSLLSKTVVAQGLNTVFLPGIVYLINPSQDILSTNGLIATISSVILVSAVVSVVIGAINPDFLIHSFSLCRADKDEPVNTFQVKLN